MNCEDYAAFWTLKLELRSELHEFIKRNTSMIEMTIDGVIRDAG